MELGELPHVGKSNFISPKFCTSGQCPSHEIKLQGAQCLIIWDSAPDYDIKLQGMQCLVIRVSAPDCEMKYGSPRNSKKFLLFIVLSELVAVDWNLVNSPMLENSIVLHPNPCSLKFQGMVWYNIS